MPTESSQTQKTALRILSLDGDGVSVLSELNIIHELMSRIQGQLGSHAMPRPCEWFQLIGGTGTGGLVAILLGRLRLSVEEATRCYLSIMGGVFDKKRVKPQDRESELERALKEMLGRYCNDPNAAMMDTDRETAGCKVIVYAMPAVAIQASTPTSIRTYRVVENQGLECSIVEAVRATTATPGILKRKAIHDGEFEVAYVGAGLGCNNPTAQLLIEAGRAFPGWATACVFSAGSGQLHPVGLREHKRRLDSMSSQLAAAAEAIAKDCERIHQDIAVRFSHTEGLYFRFNPEQGMQDIDQSDSNWLSDVQTHAKAYLAGAATSRRLNEAVKAITSGQGTAMLLNGNVILLVQNQLPIGRCPAPSAMFTGREDLLEVLRAYFFDHSHERHLFVLYGLGGAGKTQLALAFVHRYKKLFWDIFYIDATTHDTIKEGLKQFAKRAKVGDRHEDALDWLASQGKQWLIVYNNADDPAIDLSDYFPRCAYGNLLITTRNQEMIVHASHPASHRRVGEMNEDDAQALLFKTSEISRSSESLTAATTLIQHLGFLALAIVQAGAYMRSTQCNMMKYLGILLLSRDRLLRSQQIGQSDGYKLNAYATWDVSYRNPRLQPRAAQLLGIMSFMHHDGISMELFKRAAANLSEFEPRMPLTVEEGVAQEAAWDFLKSLTTLDGVWDTLLWGELINNLRSFSLLDYDPISETYSIHPLVHSWCRTIVPNATTVRECAAWTLGLCVNWERDSEDYVLQRLLSPHAMVVLTINDKSITPPLAVRLGSIFDDAHHAKHAESLYSHALSASKSRLGLDNVSTCECMYDLTHAYLHQGRWGEAETLLNELLEVERRVFGGDPFASLATMYTLALTYKPQGQWSKAEAMLLEVLEAQRGELGKENPSVLRTMYTLAQTYQSQGRWSEAEAMLLEVLEVQRRVLGKEHPHLLNTIYTLAQTYQSQGRWSEAEAMLLEVLEVERRVLGKEHPHLLTTMCTLASTYKSQGRWNKAESMLLEVLEVERRVLGKEHPHLLNTIYTLAETYRSQGRWSEAEAILLEVLEVQRRVLGKEHPHLLYTMHELASTYYCQKRWKEAGTLLVEVAEVQKRVLGREHPHTMVSISLLASVYWSQGRLSDAELLEVEDLENSKRVLGVNHPDTLTSMHNLALTYENQGKLVEAERLMTEALELQKQIKGEQHPDTQGSASALETIRAQLAQLRNS